MTRRASVLVFLVSCSSTALGCGVGDASGSGSGADDDEAGDDGDEGGSSPDGGGSGGGELQCATDYEVSGAVDHDVEPNGTCEGSGQWEVTAINPVANEDSVGCSDAPDGETFLFTVSRDGDGYAAEDGGDAGRAWTVQIRDKSGGCSATFEHEDGGAGWSLIPGEEGPGGPLDGIARYEQRGS